VASRFLSIALLLLVALLSGSAGARCPDEKIKVTLVVILAREDGNEIDPRLKAIAEEVRKLNPNLKSFQLKTMTCKSLQAGEKANFPLIDGKTAQVIVQHAADKDNKVALAITPPDQGEIVYSTVCGKFLPIVTRCQTKGRERLILAVRVQPCQGD
jgi:hypothetical protein